MRFGLTISLAVLATFGLGWSLGDGVHSALACQDPDKGSVGATYDGLEGYLATGCTCAELKAALDDEDNFTNADDWSNPSICQDVAGIFELSTIVLTDVPSRPVTGVATCYDVACADDGVSAVISNVSGDDDEIVCNGDWHPSGYP